MPAADPCHTSPIARHLDDLAALALTVVGKALARTVLLPGLNMQVDVIFIELWDASR